MTAKEREKQEAIDRLRELISPGDTVYTTLRHVSRSGMLRVVDCHIMKTDGDGRCYPYWVGAAVAQATGYPYDRKKDGIRIGGCGMDMGFAIVYELSRVLTGDGYAIKQRWL